MPKDRKDRSLSFDRLRSSPYSSSSSCGSRSLPKHSPEAEENIREWEEARCPMCMEHPHNAVLLICSSHDKGCRPYMCDTSHRHSNCFDQFRKSFAETPTLTVQSEQNSITTTDSSVVSSELTVVAEQNEEGSVSARAIACEEMVQPTLVCPLCRGHIKNWIVMESARRFMNAKSRICACETCEYSGTYSELRKHARSEHPLTRPIQADPERQHKWRMLERQRDIGDLISTLNSSLGEEREDDSVLPIDGGGWLTIFFLIRVRRPGSSARFSSWSGAGAQRSGHLTFRTPNRLSGEANDGETGSCSRDQDNDSSDGGSVSWRHVQRQNPPDNL